MLRIQVTVVSVILSTLCFYSAPSRAEQSTSNSAISSLPEWSIEPSTIQLTGPNATRGVLVHVQVQNGRLLDLTHQVRYRSNNPERVTVTAQGVLTAQSDGIAEIEVRWNEQQKIIPVRVTETENRIPPHFENDIIPILSKYGCNASGCHGKAGGQNGFMLSVFGFNPNADFDALTKEARGRRVFLAAPERSLILTKISGSIPHGGGIRLKSQQREYRLLEQWIAAGAPAGDPEAPQVTQLLIRPSERITNTLATQQLRVLAVYSDGRELDVTQIAKYQSNQESLAKVDESGLVQIGPVPGQVAIMASYAGAVATFQALIPRGKPIAHYPDLPEQNFIDHYVHAKLKKLNILPSGRSKDAEFLRRIYLDLIGTLPTASETELFLDNSDPDKRQLLIEALLARPEYSTYWALKWSDLLRVDRRSLGQKQARAYYNWIRQSFNENKKFDQFAREILTLKGRIQDTPQANYYRAIGGAGELASNTSQIFLGIRIACAQCHHHPFDRWSQRDYYGMSAFFQQVQRKGSPRGEIMTASGNPTTKHPRTGKPVFAYALGTAMQQQSPKGDRRETLVNWMTAKNNPWFAHNATNRIWAHLMGRGFIEPLDDVRETNPATNPDLLNRLAKHFIDSGYDFKALIQTITSSAAYQRSSEPNSTNEQDEQNYSRALLKRLDAEVLLDAICDVTGRPEKFPGVPYGSRAIELWDSEVDHYFLKLFGRPSRKTACDCERLTEPTVGQVLHVLNSKEIENKIAHEGGKIAEWTEQFPENTRLIDQVYLSYFSRYPTSVERDLAIQYMADSPDNRRQSAEDIAWSLMNSLEFIFNH
ncbi:MAG: DUF1549 and DUF1553 domain-containing protein [Planctomycetota bacterium]|nr:DUF1549 and DUF1553 domain-containing protein [Planctomycetota bacterium]